MEDPKCPKGKHLSKRFVDPETKNIFEFGKFVGVETDENTTKKPEEDTGEIKKPEPEISETKKAEPTMSISDVKELLRQELEEQRIQFQEQISDIRKEVSKSKAVAHTTDDGVSMPEIDEDDLLPKPKVYFTADRGFIPAVDFRNGQMHYAPKGLVYFKYICTDIRQIGNETDYITISELTTYSKKMVNYIENSSYFNTIIYLSQKDLKKMINTGMAAKVQTAASLLGSLNKTQLIAKAVQYEIDATRFTKTDDLRNEIATHLINDMIKQEVTINETIRSRNLDAETDLFPAKG